MNERRKFDIRGSVVSATIGAIVSLLVAGLTLAATFGSVTEKVEQMTKNVDRLVVSVDSMQRQNTTVCERLASLEAQVRILQSAKGGITP